ncbi:MAG: hypothetical protein ACI90V_002753, partial [Bacillariaceae sp.]
PLVNDRLDVIQAKIIPWLSVNHPLCRSTLTFVLA